MCVLYTISVCICVETTLLLLPKKNRKQKVKAPLKALSSENIPPHSLLM